MATTLVLLTALLLIDNGGGANVNLGGHRQRTVIQSTTGIINFNSTQLDEGTSRQEWIFDPQINSSEPHLILFRIFVISLHLPFDGNECPIDKRFVIGDADEDDGVNSVAYCGQLDNFEVSMYTKRVRLLLKCPPVNGEEEISIDFRFAVIDPNAPLGSLQRPGRETCHVTGFKRQWACKPVFYRGGICETQCISTSQICNGRPDCPNGEDESVETCNNNSTHAAIDLLQHWDNISLTGKSENVHLTAITSINSTLSSSVQMLCGFDEYQCKTHDKKVYCISSAWVCDGHKDCPMGEDESSLLCQSFTENPTVQRTVCPPSTYPCPKDAKCIQSRFVCDGNQDCFDSVDESQQACTWMAQTGTVQNTTSFVDWGLETRICSSTHPFYCAQMGECLRITTLCDGNIDCPGGTDEKTQACSVREKWDKVNGLPLVTSGECANGVSSPPWIARVSSGGCFLCYGVILQGRQNSWWVLTSSTCGHFLPATSINVYPGNTTIKYSVLARIESEGNSMNSQTGMSLLQINHHSLNTTNSVSIPSMLTSFQLHDIKNNATPVSQCSLITPLLCQPELAKRNEMFAIQTAVELELGDCMKYYGNVNDPSKYTCISQKMCIQPGLGAVLVCSNGFLGFSYIGASCSQGQIGWPALIALITDELLTWIKVTTGHNELSLSAVSICGIVPNFSFPWFVVFNITYPQNTICLGAYVANDSFPLITSMRCLRKCLRANKHRENSCELEKAELILTNLTGGKPRWNTPAVPNSFMPALCPAKQLEARLARSTSPWRYCLVTHLSATSGKLVEFEMVKVSSFSSCSMEPFYNQNLQKESLCVSSIDGKMPLNCARWTDSGLVQCMRMDDGRWEMVGLAPTCPNRPTMRWILRLLEL